MALSLQRIFVLAGPAAANADGGAAAQVAAHSVAAAGAGAGAVAGASSVQPSHFRDVPAPACMHWADQYLYVHSSTRGLLEFDAPTGVRTKRLPLIGAGSSSGADGGRPVCLASSTNTSGRSMAGGLSSTGYSTNSSCATDCLCVGTESVLTKFPFRYLVVLVGSCCSLHQFVDGLAHRWRRCCCTPAGYCSSTCQERPESSCAASNLQCPLALLCLCCLQWCTKGVEPHSHSHTRAHAHALTTNLTIDGRSRCLI